MLHRQLSADLDSVGPAWRWLVPGLAGLAGLSAALLLVATGQPLLAAAALIGGAVAATILIRRGAPAPAPVAAVLESGPDFALIGSVLGLCQDAAAITSEEGSLLIANAAYRERFGGTPPPLQLGTDQPSLEALQLASALAWRDGSGCVGAIATAAGPVAVEVERVGALGNEVLWRFPAAAAQDHAAARSRELTGPLGDRLDAAGMMAVIAGADGRLVSVNRSFAARAIAPGIAIDSLTLADVVVPAAEGQMRLASDGDAARPLSAIRMALGSGEGGGEELLLLLDPHQGGSMAASADIQALLEILPIGLALVDRDGRFLTMNQVFRSAAAIKSPTMPVYPGDLVVKEDKAPVADAVRRNARGPAMSGDLAVRLANNTAEPVALTIAGVRGLGDAAVLLLLKDNSEEAKLKRQIAQATKMQVVGQLAGGVAHDFNNILTAIIGHCDLMLMRHTPGDSDYDDIQQIKSNSNRAAGLTRQLLAFSRQQTLRPQVLKLPDVVAEVSHLLKRLLGETVELVVKHGRALGSVRADPGQLEQVIVNLAVNARDAIAAKGSGTLTIQTYSVSADQVAELGSEILPTADYSALSVTDTGCGIPASVLGKVFEPFFTTKEVGKGTGLGLSTVYGIVKQSGGFIFADSKVGEGTRFVIYLPVHREEAGTEKPRKVAKPKEQDLWGTGTVLLVEDEPMVRGVAERALTRHGYKVLTADNGEEALEILHRGEEIALLISDVVMPVMDGPTMVREARKTWPELKILFMSGYAEEQLRKSIDIADVAFLPKPFSVQELAEAARRSIGPKIDL